MTVEPILNSVYIVYLLFVLFGLTGFLTIFYLYYLHESLHWIGSKLLGYTPSFIYKFGFIPIEVNEGFPCNVKPTLKDKIIILYSPYLICLPLELIVFLISYNMFMKSGNIYLLPIALSSIVSFSVEILFTIRGENFYHIDHPEGGENPQ